MRIPLLSILALSSLAVARVHGQEAAPVQMSPVTVRAGPLGLIGVRLSVDTGIFGFVSSKARIKELTISEVLKDSAAERAGLLAGDRILQIDGVPVTHLTINSLREISDREKGETIELVVRSPDAMTPRNVPVTLGARKIPQN